jgi:uncharacterized membrane protein
MPFCANCGTEASGRFCPKCGSPVEGPAPQQPQPGAPYAPAPPPPAPAAQAGGLDENMACALCYLATILTGILFLVLEPYNRNRNIRFHAFQAIFVGVGLIAVSILIGILGTIIGYVPFIGWVVVVLLYPLFGLGAFALWLMLMYKAYNNQRWVLPVIGPMAEKQV